MATLCEVKTINISAAEVERQRSGGVGTTLLEVEGGLLSAITSALCNAADQMHEFNRANDVGRIVYLIVNFDNNADFAREYQRQAREHIEKVKPLGIEVFLSFKAPFQR